MTKSAFEHIPSRGVITPRQGLNPRRPYDHQQAAMRALDAMNKLPSFSTMVVLPTGGGKTFTASNWLLKNAINKRRKVLWIAHRHMLLDQAAESFRSYAYADLTPDIGQFSYRIVSGQPSHGSVADINRGDDLVIASKDSLRSRPDKLEAWLTGEKEMFLVVDEAHHATAKTYRMLIELLKSYVPNVKIVGLTATPFRTLEAEKGLLSKIFKDGIVDGRPARGESGIAFQIGLQDLISRQILSRPLMEMCETSNMFGESLGEKELEAMQRLDSIPEKVAKQMVENRDRNRLIVDTYVNGAEKYGKTILFAVNIQHAVVLKELFDKAGVRSDIVVSQLKDDETGRMRSNAENAAAIEGYRDGDIDVLINVNILTEGVDLPKTETVFLTRPTASSILMTQMIGRALRGVKSGGTAESHIVSFVDDWDERVAWVNPESLFAGNNKFNETDPKEREREDVRAIALSKIREFAMILDASVDTLMLESIPFIERIPLGMYVFTYTERGDDDGAVEGADVSCQVMVYTSSEDALHRYIDSLPELVSSHGLDDEEFASDVILSAMVVQSRRAFFSASMVPPVRDKDIEAILKYFLQFGAAPTFYSFDTIDRSRLDVTAIALEIFSRDMSVSQKKEYRDRIWDEGDDNLLRLFFGHKRNFIHALDTEIGKLSDPELYATAAVVTVPPEAVMSASEPSPAASVKAVASSGGKTRASSPVRKTVRRTREQLQPSKDVLETFSRYVPIGVTVNERTGQPVKKFGANAVTSVEDGATVLYSNGFRVLEADVLDLRLLTYRLDGEEHGWRTPGYGFRHVQDFVARQLGLKEAPTLEELTAMAADPLKEVEEFEVVVGDASASEPSLPPFRENAEKPVNPSRLSKTPAVSKAAPASIVRNEPASLSASKAETKPEPDQVDPVVVEAEPEPNGIAEPPAVIAPEVYAGLEPLRPTGLVNERANRPYKTFNGKPRLMRRGQYEYLYSEARLKLARWSQIEGLVLYEYDALGRFSGWASQTESPYSRDYATRKLMSIGKLKRAVGFTIGKLRLMAKEPGSMVRIEKQSLSESYPAGGGERSQVEEESDKVQEGVSSESLTSKEALAEADRLRVYDGYIVVELTHSQVACIREAGARVSDVFDQQGRAYRLPERFSNVRGRYERIGFIRINEKCIARPSAVKMVKTGTVNEALIKGRDRFEYMSESAVALLREKKPDLFKGMGGK